MVVRRSAALTSRSCAGQARTANGAATRRAVPAITAAQRRAGVTGPPCGESTSARVRWFSPREAARLGAVRRRGDLRGHARVDEVTGQHLPRLPPAEQAPDLAVGVDGALEALGRGLLAEREAGQPLERLRVDLEPGRDRLVDHPAERDVGEAVVVVLAADVAVHAGEPLLDVPALGRGHGLRVEAVDRVRASLLVQGHRVPRDLDVDDAPRRRPPGLLELRLEVQPADRLDGVPDPEEPHLVQVRVERVREVRVAEPLVEQPTRPEELGLLLGRRVLRPVLGVELEGVRREVVDPGPQAGRRCAASRSGRAPCRRRGRSRRRRSGHRAGSSSRARCRPPRCCPSPRTRPPARRRASPSCPCSSPPRARPSSRRPGRSRRAGSRTSRRRRTCARRSSSRSPARCSCRPGRPPGSAPHPPPSAHHAPVVEETRQGTHGHRGRCSRQHRSLVEEGRSPVTRPASEPATSGGPDHK